MFQNNKILKNNKTAKFDRTKSVLFQRFFRKQFDSGLIHSFAGKFNAVCVIFSKINLICKSKLRKKPLLETFTLNLRLCIFVSNFKKQMQYFTSVEIL